MTTHTMDVYEFMSEALRWGTGITFEGAKALHNLYTGGGKYSVDVDKKELKRWVEYSSPYEALSDFTRDDLFDVLGLERGNFFHTELENLARENGGFLANMIAIHISVKADKITLHTNKGSVLVYD